MHQTAVQQRKSGYQFPVDLASCFLHLASISRAVGQCSLCDVRISFSDTKTRDRGEVIDENIRLYQAGLISRRQALMAVYDCSPEEADRLEREIKT